MKVPTLIASTLLAACLLAPAAAKNHGETSRAETTQTEQAETTTATQKVHVELAKEILVLTNEERARHGLAPLTLNLDLEKAALDHSREMQILGYFSHTSPVPGRETARLRVNKYGLNPRFVAENLYECSGYEISIVARMAVKDLMNSPGHRKNILSPMATHLGVGFVETDGAVSITQVFGGGL